MSCLNKASQPRTHFVKESTNQHPARERCESLGRVIWFDVDPVLLCTEDDAVACDPRGAKGGN